MPEQDFTKRLTLVVRKDLAGWQAANTIAHISAYIGHKLEGDFSTGDVFVTADAQPYPRNSQYPMIIKRANSSKQLRTVLTKAREAGIMHHAFIKEMIETTDDAEIVRILAEKRDTEVEILGIGVFGGNEEINSLTKKFSLWE